MKKILLILMILSSFIYADFNRTTYGTVIDNSTSLEWHDTIMTYSPLAPITEKISDWNLSTTVCERIVIYGSISPYERISYDWRLPNQLELLSIVDYTVPAPTIKEEFTDINNSIYWSSTSSINDRNKAWSVDFSTGETKRVDKSLSYNIRCVRAGHLPIL
jgi:L,D-peptidoglycan transpeptidase YkuD (ErfK/YbiS/YcfS/YnhG family)